ncbi:MAG TPA: hypothetical protein VIQ55_03670, partial [Burkholderiales bacterium]
MILLRSGKPGLETLLLQRTHGAAFLGGAYVFPGGSLDAADAAAHRVVGLSEAQANERLGLPTGGLAYYVAALRECFEEAGVLLAVHKDGAPVSAGRAAALLPWRERFFEMLEKEDLYIPAG